MTVFLRPQLAATPVDYIKSLEKAGLVVMPQRYLAIYTFSKGAGPAGVDGTDGIDGAQGIQGIQGEPYLHDTIIAAASDEYSDLEVDLSIAATHFRAPFPLEIEYIRISLSGAPTGADVIVDVKMNGTSLFSTYLHIDPSDTTSVGSATPAVLSTTTVPDDAEFTVFIRQIGSGDAGTGLKVAITGTKVP